MRKEDSNITFGDKFCIYCGLTVAEYINGYYVVLENHVNGYLHEGCIEKMTGGVCQ
jgi:hypothetical protein